VLKRSERIVVCEGDTANGLAKEFCDKHFTSASEEESKLMQEKLGELL
jgi:hypothetical protein